MPLSLLPTPQKDHAPSFTFCALTLLFLSPIRSGQHHFVPCQCIVLDHIRGLTSLFNLPSFFLSHTYSVSVNNLLCVQTTFSPGRDFTSYHPACRHCRALRARLNNQLRYFDWCRSLLSIHAISEQHILAKQESWKSQPMCRTANTRSNQTFIRTTVNIKSLEARPLIQCQCILSRRTNIRMSDVQVNVRRHIRALLPARSLHRRTM